MRNRTESQPLLLGAAGKQAEKGRRSKYGGGGQKSSHFPENIVLNRLYSFISSTWKATVAAIARKLTMMTPVKNLELNTFASSFTLS